MCEIGRCAKNQDVDRSQCRENKDTLHAYRIVLSVQKQASKNIQGDIVETHDPKSWNVLGRRSQAYGATTKNISCHYGIRVNGNVADYSTGAFTISTLLALVAQEHTERSWNPNRPLYPHP
jgi:hypothetical protein